MSFRGVRARSAAWVGGLCVVLLAATLRAGVPDPDYVFRVEHVTAQPGQTVEVSYFLDNTGGAVGGWVIATAVPGSPTIGAVELGADAQALNDGAGPELLDIDLSPVGDSDAATVSAIVDAEPPFDGEVLAPGIGLHMQTAVVQVPSSATVGGVFAVEFIDDALGDPPLTNVVFVAGVAIQPVLLSGSITIVPPPNDACEDSLEIFDGLTPFSTGGAATDGLPDPVCDFFGIPQVSQDIWFDYIATCTGDLTADTCEDLGGSADYDSKIAVYDGCAGAACPPSDILGCDDDTCSVGFHSSLTVPVTQGNCYSIRVGGFATGDVGDGQLQVTCDGVSTGACCLSDVSCVELADPAACAAMGGVFQGAPSACDDVQCFSCPRSDCATGLTQTVAPEPQAPTPACESSFGSAVTGWARCYDLIAELDQPFANVHAVTFGVHDATPGGVLVAVNLYQDTGCPPSMSTAAVLASEQVVVDAADGGTLITVPFDDVLVGGSLVVEILQVEDGTAPPCDPATGENCFSFHPASNPLGQCGPSLVRADDCLIEDWLDLAELAFPDTHLLQMVDMTCSACGPGAGPCQSSNGSPGCEVPACCDQVCAADPFCCEVTWDAICADVAGLVPACLDNDLCDSALTIFPGLTPFSTAGASTDGPDYNGIVDCGAFGDDIVHQDLWFEHTATCTGTLQVTTCEQLGGAADYDTRLAIHGACGGPGCAGDTAVACNDDDPDLPCGSSVGGFHSTLAVPVLQGDCYKIRVGGFQLGAVGSGQLNVTCDGTTSCTTVADCADHDGDGVRDDACLWWQCLDGVCVSTPRGGGQGDMGGVAGSCQIDGVCEGNDTFHARNCFANENTLGDSGYPCEDLPPFAINVDAAGTFGSCVLDGICDANDVFAARNCFSNENTMGMVPYPCTCDGPGPAPGFESAPPVPQPRAVAAAELSLRAPRSVRAGEQFTVDAYLDDALESLRGYQLHLGVRGGGAHGGIALVDIFIDYSRADFVFAGGGHWQAFNRGRGQMMAGLDGPGVATPARAYLATFTFRAAKDARGAFVVELQYDDRAARPGGRTFLFAGPLRKIAIRAARPALVAIDDGRRRDEGVTLGG